MLGVGAITILFLFYCSWLIWRSLVTRDAPTVCRSPGKELPQGNGWSIVSTIDDSCKGLVYKALTSNNETIAVKQVNLPSFKLSVYPKWYNEGMFELDNEISILSCLQHRFIVRYLGSSKTEKTVDIWYEYVLGSSIRDLYVEKKFDRSKIPDYTRQILKAIMYLHKNNIVHRDLSCSNILLDDKGVVKLVGFHFAQEIEDNRTAAREKEYAEWIRWTAPEILASPGYCGSFSDIWSLGCTVLEMATASFPYSNLPWFDAVLKVAAGEIPMMPEELPKDCREFVEICLQIDPLNRPNASQLLQHPFVARAKTNRSPQSQDLATPAHLTPVKPPSAPSQDLTPPSISSQDLTPPAATPPSAPSQDLTPPSPFLR